MTAIADLSELIRLMTGGDGGAPELVPFGKAPRHTGASGNVYATALASIHSLWRMEGFTGPGAIPTNEACALGLAGALPLTAPAAGKTKRLVSVSFLCSASGTLFLYDRLVATSGLNASLATSQTTNLPTAPLTRYTDGVGVEVWLEGYALLGSSQRVATITYTNSAGVSGRTGAAGFIGGNPWNMTNTVGSGAVPMTLQAGDRGVRTVESVQLSASTGAAGNFGVTLVKPIAIIPTIAANQGAVWNALEMGGPIDIGTDPALALFFAQGIASVPSNPIGQVLVCEKS
jgi:hypothetical protein